MKKVMTTGDFSLFHLIWIEYKNITFVSNGFHFLFNAELNFLFFMPLSLKELSTINEPVIHFLSAR